MDKNGGKLILLQFHALSDHQHFRQFYLALHLFVLSALEI